MRCTTRKRSTAIHAFAILAALVFLASASNAQSWPQRTVRMIVPVAPGSSPDVAARVFAERLAAKWGKAVVVENFPGADGLIGTTAFTAAQDDHVLLFSFAAPLTVYPFTQDKLSYDPVRDILPVSVAVETFGTLAVPASLPVATLADLVETVRSQPGKLNWGTGGGAFPILMGGFVKSAKLDMVPVPYRNQNLAIQDLAENRIQVFATAMTAVLPLVQAGKIRLLAVTNKKRSPLLPDVPTVSEARFPALTFEGFIGVFAPRGTPDERRQRIASEIQTIAADAEVVKLLSTTGQIVRGSTPAEFIAAIEDQRSQIAAASRLIGKPPR